MNYILFDTNTNLHNDKYSFQKNITKCFKYDFSVIYIHDLGKYFSLIVKACCVAIHPKTAELA